MPKSKMALGPFLEEIENLCAPLDSEQLLGIIIDLTKEFPTSERRDFLAYFQELVPDGAAAELAGVDNETLAATGAKPQAGALLADYYYCRFNRFAGFRRELQAIVVTSEILQKKTASLCHDSRRKPAGLKPWSGPADAG